MTSDSKFNTRTAGFSLIEIAVVLVIVSILVAIVASPLASQLEARRTEDIRRQLDMINDALIGFAMANGRLPCASSLASNGVESLAVPANGTCDFYSGFLPAVTLGIAPQDQNGFAIDAWGLPQNRIRYAVFDILATSGTGCPTTPVTHPLTKAGGMREAGMNCLANYNSDTVVPPKTLLTVCSNTPASAQPFCTATKLTITAPFIVMSLGKNAPTGGLATTDEGFNSGTRGNGTVFVSHIPTTSTAPSGEFDDLVTWTSLNTLFARMVQAGNLP